MNILITSGGTVEPIDNVRGITNFAAGRLISARRTVSLKMFLHKALDIPIRLCYN
jgi:phosphopantothenoylcysteine synthetase/decarboxylase